MQIFRRSIKTNYVFVVCVIGWTVVLLGILFIFINEFKNKCQIECSIFFGQERMVEWETLLIGIGAIIGYYSAMIRKQREALLKEAEEKALKIEYLRVKLNFQNEILNYEKLIYQKENSLSSAVLGVKTLLITQQIINSKIEELAGLSVGVAIDNEALSSAIRTTEKFSDILKETSDQNILVEVNGFILRTFDFISRMLIDAQTLRVAFYKDNEEAIRKYKNKVGI